MPWWVWLYVAVVALLTVAGILEELKSGSKLHPLGTALSLASMIGCIAAAFIAEIASLLGLGVILLLAFVLLYDFWLSKKNLDLNPEAFWSNQPSVHSRMDILSATLIVAPGYLAGLWASYQAIMAFIGQ